MIWIAFGDLLVNPAAVWILHEGRSESRDVKGVWPSVLDDTLGSGQTIVAGTLTCAFAPPLGGASRRRRRADRDPRPAVWAIISGCESLTVHATVAGRQRGRLLREMRDIIRRFFGNVHGTTASGLRARTTAPSVGTAGSDGRDRAGESS